MVYRINLMLLLSSMVLVNASAEPRIHRIEPLCLTIGETTKVTVIGEHLREKEATTDIWATFPGTWEPIEPVVEPGKEPDARRIQFRVSLPAEVKPGPGAIRAWHKKGLSLPYLLLLDTTPASHNFLTKSDAPETYTFGVRAGQNLTYEIWSNRLNQDTDLLMTLHDVQGKELAMADDDEVYGADPVLHFTAPADGTYRLKMHDIRWRAGPQACLRIAKQPLLAVANPPDVRRTPKEVESITIPAEVDQYLTITPTTLPIGSPALLLLELYDPKGNRCAQSGTGDTLDEVLRKKIDQAGTYELRVRELLGREGLPYDLDISFDQAPFSVTVDGNRTWREVPLGAEQKIKFRVSRQNYDGPITLTSTAFTMTNHVIPEKKGDIEAIFTLSPELTAEQLIPFTVEASAEIHGRRYATAVNTLPQLRGTPKRLLRWPDGLDGIQYLITAPPAKKEENP
ncbi:MAG: hypothetical protein ACI97B_000806 [Verrucomicrobiales bacterium]